VARRKREHNLNGQRIALAAAPPVSPRRSAPWAAMRRAPRDASRAA